VRPSSVCEDRCVSLTGWGERNVKLTTGQSDRFWFWSTPPQFAADQSDGLVMRVALD
jgi:hypothetical protein